MSCPHSVVAQGGTAIGRIGASPQRNTVERIISYECSVKGCKEHGTVILKSQIKGAMPMCLKCAGLESISEWMSIKFGTHPRISKE